VTHRSATALVFITSAAVLVTEILAGRLMAPYVGVSLETFTGIIGTILAGIAVGSALGGRLADAVDPRPVLPALVAVGGGLVWLSLPIVTALGPRVGEGPAAIVGLTVAAFLAPATVLSAVSPMVAKVRLGDLDETGSVVGGLSASGTAGALAGTFLTGFVLIAYVPTRPTIIGTGVILVLIALAMVGRRALVTPLPIVVLGGVLALTATTSVPCEFETRYYCARIEIDAADPGSRVLVLDTLRHSHVDLADPTHLEFRYVRLFAQVAETLPEGPVSALHVGGGGFTFPRYLGAVSPGSTNTVLEIDPELVEIARNHLGLVTGPSMPVVTGDARLSIEDLPTDAFDLVVGDAYGGRSVPWHLTTTEFMAEINRVLRPGGVYAMNVIDGGASQFARAELATLADVFSTTAAIIPTDGIPAGFAANLILIASDSDITGLSVAIRDGKLVRGAELDAFVGDARPLTDDFAPVDRLTR
jgi:spermidine synthase